ncbi:MAG: 30S ribosome-binding factor RbfA [Dehalococcoidia bacterium]
MTRRTDSVHRLLQEEISGIIARDLKDPRLGAMVSVTQVEMVPDFSKAVVFVSLMGEPDKVEETFAALTSAGPFIHHELRERLSLRKTPQLTFRRDDSIERGVRLAHLIDEVNRPHESTA